MGSEACTYRYPLNGFGHTLKQGLPYGGSLKPSGEDAPVKPKPPFPKPLFQVQRYNYLQIQQNNFVHIDLP